MRPALSLSLSGQVLLQRGAGGVPPGGAPAVAARVLLAVADEDGGGAAQRRVLQDRHTRLPGGVRARGGAGAPERNGGSGLLASGRAQGCRRRCCCGVREPMIQDPKQDAFAG